MCVCVCVCADMCQPRRRFWKQRWHISRPVRSISTWEEEENTKYLFVHIITVLFTCCAFYFCVKRKHEHEVLGNICTIMSNRLDVCSTARKTGRTRKRRKVRHYSYYYYSVEAEGSELLCGSSILHQNRQTGPTLLQSTLCYELCCPNCFTSDIFFFL